MQKTAFLKAAGAAALLLASSGAFAAEWNWAPEREHGFYERYTRDPGRPYKGDFDFRVGAVVPSGVEVTEAPVDFDYAPARAYRYVRADNRVIVVEPKTRTVVRVIER